MAGPTESLRLELVEPDGSLIDLGQVTAEVDPQRGPAGMIAGVGVFSSELPLDEVRRRCGVLRAVYLAAKPTTWRVTPSGLEPFVLAYHVESFAAGGRSFELMLEREADQTKAVAWPSSEHGFGDYTPEPSVVTLEPTEEELAERARLAAGNE